jgi:predicted  nucleic acid-binding Zn-ribbon protein
LLALAALSGLWLSADQASALRPVHVGPGSGAIPVASEATNNRPSGIGTEPLTDLQEALEATRRKLEELTAAAAKIDANVDLQTENQALREDKDRLAADLEQAVARTSELESASRRAEARIVELSKAIDAGRRRSVRLEQDLTRLRQANAGLERNVADVQAARDAAIAGAGETQAKTAKKLDQAVAAAARSKSELDAVREQLDQAAGAAREAELARQAARSEADALQAEVARARQELAAARADADALRAENAQLEQHISSLHAELAAATEAARQNLILMTEKIAILNGTLDSARSPEPVPDDSPQPAPDAAPSASANATPVSAAPPGPEPADPRGVQGVERPSELAMGEPPEALAAIDPAIARFNADIKTLNELEMSAAGQGVFSGVKSVNGREVLVGATAAWGSLPPVGQESYVDSLLAAWVAIQGDDEPAVIAIVDEDGRVLLEKSRPRGLR